MKPKNKILLVIAFVVCSGVVIYKKFSFFARACPLSTKTEYYSNGQKRFELHSRCGIHDGVLKVWNEKGQLIHNENYVMGKQDGEFLQYDDSTGWIQTKRYYTMDELDSEIYYMDGKKYGTNIYLKPRVNFREITAI